jgi:hypothetical protein
MHTTCQPLPRSVAEGILQGATRAICDRPGDTAEQRESLTRQMIHCTMGFEPRDGLEYMIATTVFGHYQLILDSMRDALRGQMDSVKANTKTTMVALDRAMLSFNREMRVLRQRPLAPWAEEAQRQGEAAAAAAPQATNEAAGELSTPPDALAAAAIAAVAADPTAPVAADPAPAAPAPVAPTPERSEPLPAGTPAQQAPAPEGRPGAPVYDPAAPLPDGWDDGTMEEHVVLFKEALAAMSVTLAELKAFEESRTAERTASGD